MANDLTFYDQHGAAVAYLEPGGSIYLYDGSPVAYLDEDGESIYGYSGRHLGWFVDGWVRDHSGGAVYFTEAATGGPMKPMKGIRPMKGMRGMRPMRGMRSMRPMKPAWSSGWGDAASFFDA